MPRAAAQVAAILEALGGAAAGGGRRGDAAEPAPAAAPDTDPAAARPAREAAGGDGGGDEAAAGRRPGWALLAAHPDREALVEAERRFLARALALLPARRARPALLPSTPAAAVCAGHQALAPCGPWS